MPFPYSAGSAHVHFEPAMEIEHCKRQGALWEFESTNNRIRTTPKQEWEIVKGICECPAESQPAHVKRKRRIPKIEELLALDASKEANLIEAEVLAIVLYTGPMVRSSIHPK